MLRCFHQVSPLFCMMFRKHHILTLNSYLIIVKGLMPNVVNTFYHLYTGPDTNAPLWLVSGRNWITLFMVILVPLSFMPSIDSLRHASYVAVFSVGKS